MINENKKTQADFMKKKLKKGSRVGMKITSTV